MCGKGWSGQAATEDRVQREDGAYSSVTLSSDDSRICITLCIRIITLKAWLFLVLKV